MAAGQALCLPPTCEVTHTVLEEDTCVQVGFDYSVGWQKIVSWNAGLNARCSDIWSTNPFWGRVICVSAPGGASEGGGGDDGGGDGETPGNGGVGGPGGSGDGYANEPVDPPEGATVAKDTTLHCGEFIQAEDGLGCSVMVARAVVTMGLFLAANPSLETAASCTSDLVIGNWYCLHPVYGFDVEEG
ncbi:LysM peptidoglycan-binding domain-containing protein, partial [Candidatus Bathyarchaeota archaeon]|nr:LysM peptidoglycan-binding domain-containing protein [Candidatus Bathyarchaeota archaeon]